MRLNNRLILLAAVSGCIAFTLAGCPQGPTGSNGTGGPPGTLKLLITDKLFPYEFIAEANVTITRVEVRAAEGDDANSDNANDNSSDDSLDDAGGADPLSHAGKRADGSDDGAKDNGDAEDGDDSDSESFIVIFEGEKSFNLLDLRNGRADLLADTEIPSGHYTQMRIHVSEGEVVLNDGREFPLKVPSGDSSGIKLHFDFEIGAGAQTQLLLDVDLSRAFSAIPSGHIEDVSTIREFKFHPSLSMRLINIAEAASIGGFVTDAAAAPLAGVAVTAYKGDEEVSSTATDPDGTYLLGGLPAGTYRVEFSFAGYQDVQVENVEAESGAATENVNAVLQPAAS